MSSGESRVYDESFIAAADLRAYQFCIVAISAANTVNVSGANGIAIGILQNKPNSGQAAEVRMLGISKLFCKGDGTEITVGSFIESAAAGVGVISNTDKHNVVAMALEGTTAASELLSVLLTGPFTLSHA